MSTRSPTSPVSSHHRFLQSLVSSHFEGDGLHPTPKELDRVSRVFTKAGGSWEALMRGSVDDFALIRRVIKVAVKQGYISKSPKWG